MKIYSEAGSNISSLEDTDKEGEESKGVGVTNDDTDGELPGLGACILAFFAMTSLLLGAVMTWITVSLISKYLFDAHNPYFQAVVLAVWTGIIFSMTPTFGNARRVKTASAKILRLPTSPLDKDP